jgi:hypothetical protein
MPSSRPSLISPVIELIRKINPSSILEVGVGFGKWGFLFREYLDIWNMRYRREEWRVRIDGIEVFDYYITDIQRRVYDNIYLKSAEDVIDELIDYDLIFLGDVIEHFEKQSGVEFLRKCWSKSKKAIVITTPVNPSPQGVVFDNPYEKHRSFWQYEDFRDIFRSGEYRIIDDRFLLFWALKKGSTILDEREKTGDGFFLKLRRILGCIKRCITGRV